MAKGRDFSIDTSPTKRVVVDSLTRDVSVEACIFDLVDNSLDAAKETAQANLTNDGNALVDDYSGFFVKLTINGDGLDISDNCGGISVDKLRTMVLRFGERSAHKAGIGVFGVGLNRALFRIGQVTHLQTDTGAERAQLVLNVEEYLKNDKDWNLPAESFASKGDVGTEIEIRKPSSEVSQRFANPDFENDLRTEMSMRYARFLKMGMLIELNGSKILGQEILIRENSPFSDGLVPKFFHVNGVSIYIQYGQHEIHRFTNEVDYDKEINKPLTSQYGWTVLCNDRTVLLNDRTFKTGWDSFHTEFYGFVGVVSFVSEDPSLLPWTTTKDDVDLNSQVYQRALDEMRSSAKKWRTFSAERKKGAKKGEVLTPIPPVRRPPTHHSSDPTHVKPSTPPPSPVRIPIKKPVVKVDHNQLRFVLPSDIDETNCEEKLLTLVHEAKSLDIGTHSYSALALMRMLFETAVLNHAVRHQYADAMKAAAITTRNAVRTKAMTPTEENRAVPSFDESLDFLDGNHAVWGAIKATQLIHCIGRTRNQKQLMNSAMHSGWQAIDRTTVFQIRTELLPLLRHLIEN